MVSGYRIEGVLGTGGMGTVYLAKNPTLPRHDALKVLSTELSQDQGFRERFIREADVASVLDHPNIVSIYSRGETDDGQLWIAMQYVSGTDAEAAMRAGTMNPMRAIHIVGEVAKALDYAHQRQVVHHDVKPANFLLANAFGDDEQVLLSDFGVARALDDVGASMDNSLTATLAYAAPEVIAGNPIDGRADLYSLGCTLFRMLTGRKPFQEADDMAAVMLAHLHQDPPALSRHLPWSTPQLDWVMAKALAKDPAQRFQSAREFAHAAAEAVRDALSRTAAPAPAPSPRPAPPVDPQPARPGPPPPVNPRPPQPSRAARSSGPVNPKVLIAAGVVVAGVVLGVVGFLVLRPSSAAQESAAPATSEPDPAAEQRLLGMLPGGYDEGACEPVAAPEGAVARVSCEANTDPGGPASATYTLARDAGALESTFDAIVAESSMVNCPGNIQSPGPWRRNATPDQVSGTLYCGLQGNVPVVGWTDDEELFVAEVHADPQGPNLAQLYTWWSSHS